MHATESLTEADRLMTVCNSCRYCEGLCAVFPAMEMRRAFADGDLNYLANLCHGCGACLYDCQFAPPHEFAVNVPRNLAIVRAESYRHYAWPRALAPVFDRNGLWIALLVVACVTAFILAFTGTDARNGDFYRLMPHNAMAGLFGAVFAYAILALTMSLRSFWRDSGERAASWRDLWQAMRDAGSLRYLDGGGVGCMNEDERPTDNRRLYHHLTFYGFLLCFAATSVATLYHYLLGRHAPYAYTDLPVLLGTAGGIGLVIGPVGLLAAKFKRDPSLRAHTGMDVAFLVMLFLTSATGLALLALRNTSSLAPLLAIHLGVVLALFLTLPYGKFVHGLYRFAALVRYAQEMRQL
ncbi:tricarballylate utilization 4Fe-4S protein TcuB [Roseiterribacter gracilis]|uniref:Tricarballylate utilization protein B n=1 Tax=Roseiterribacter gracilis TaxID=2812848 RepID=A0A8S8XFG1_9PROT|nr:tricarballylate utilization protein B [Rhodospirillales bacterium TMPK1]